MGDLVADLWAFDFDGTLVESAKFKRDAFFDVFPARLAEVVDSVLRQDPDGSRHVVIPRMVAAADDPTLDANALIAAYAATVAEQVLKAPSVPEAQDALEWAAAHGTACLFSMSPHIELGKAIEARGWGIYFSDIKGFPFRKPNSLDGWIARFSPSAVTVIGDGVSDAEAAHHANARFLLAETGWPNTLMTGGFR